MIGIIPSIDKTYVVDGPFCENMKEGYLYHDTDNKLYMYSNTYTRPCSGSGFFPVYDGKKKMNGPSSNNKTLNDVVEVDIKHISDIVNEEVAMNIINKRRRCEDSHVLKPSISTNDNMFTQCIKGVICEKNLTMSDLIVECKPPIDPKIINNYYTSLIKIPFMRADKWDIWISCILHVSYKISIYNDDQLILSYEYPKDKFSINNVYYDEDDDPLKKIVKMITKICDIHKQDLKSRETDSYSVNNLLTIINSKKPLSAQLFSRFIKLSGLQYKITMYDNGKNIFEYYQD